MSDPTSEIKETKESKEAAQKIKKLADDVVKDIHRHENPSLNIPVRSLSNVKFDEKKSIIELGKETQIRYFFNVAQAKKFMQSVLIASACNELLKQGKTTSIRDLYYMTKHTIGDTHHNTFDDQVESVCPDETLLVRINNELKLATGYEIIEFAKQTGQLIYDHNGKKRWKNVDMKVCAFDESYKIREIDAALVMQHPPNNVKKITTSSGRSVKVTNCHSVFTCKNGLPKPIEVKQLSEGDWLALPRNIHIDTDNKKINLAKLLIEKLTDKELKSLYLKGHLEDINEIIRRIGKEELKLFSKNYKNIWSDVTANWRHWKTLPLRLIKICAIDIEDVLPRLKICAKGADKSFNSLISKDEHLGAIFGFLISEGAHSRFTKRGKDERFVGISNNSKDLMDKFRDSFIAVFGGNSITCKTTQYRDKIYRLNLGNNTISYILTALGYKPVRAWEKEIPPCLLDSPNECVNSFLKWFRLGDGSIQTEKLRIRYHTTSKKLVNGLTFLLLRQSIFPRIYTYERKKTNHHTIYEIRVNSREYVKKLSEITGDFKYEDLNNKSLLSGDRIPDLGTKIYQARKSCGKLNETTYKKLPWYAIENQQAAISRGTLTKVVQLLLPYAESKELMNLAEIANNDICWDQIVKIEETETPEFTLDIAVRPTQNFIGGDGLLLLHNSDPIIEDLEVTIDSLREELNLFASNGGALVGDITVYDLGDKIDCSKMGSGGWSIPSIVEPNTVQFKDCKAKYILMVEKDAVWRRLNEDKFWKKEKCILMHGQGMAPRGVRRLLYRLVNELKLPLYVMTDNDSWGYYIYSVIKQGSINLAYESQRMAVPSAKFIGLSSFDKDEYGLPDTVTIKLNDQDKDRAKQILDYPWFQKKEWQKEIKHMLEKGVKLELEALSAKGISFVTDTYLPDKLKKKKWLD